MTEHGAEAVGYVCVTVIILAMIACCSTCVIMDKENRKPVPAERAPAVPR